MFRLWVKGPDYSLGRYLIRGNLVGLVRAEIHLVFGLIQKILKDPTPRLKIPEYLAKDRISANTENALSPDVISKSALEIIVDRIKSTNVEIENRTLKLCGDFGH
jgi:hypothetical protein